MRSAERRELGGAYMKENEQGLGDRDWDYMRDRDEAYVKENKRGLGDRDWD
jgi:hypothetical protein